MIFRLLIFIALVTQGISGICEANKSINVADSLFENKKYTEAFEIYSNIYNSGESSPAMLTKMAFIKEGLGNYSEALYYLDHYYKKTSNKKVLTKMYELADQNNLMGYEFSDYKFFINNINKYSALILLGLLSISLLIITLMFFKKVKGIRAAPWIVLQIIILTSGVIILNQYFNKPEAIIRINQTILMNGPSAAAEPLEMLEKGHKVMLIEEGDIWSKVKISDQEAYVRSNRLLKLF